MAALGWLECLAPPAIAAPRIRSGQGFRSFVPNNDLDAVAGDPSRIGEIRTPKMIRPILFKAETPLLYLWTFEDSPEARANAAAVCAISERLYQLGRGVDMAWAAAESMSSDEGDARLAAHDGAIYRPDKVGGGVALSVPIAGSLSSLVERYREMRNRFQSSVESRRPRNGRPSVEIGQVFAQPRKPRFGQFSYDSPAARLLFDLTGANAPWRLDRIVELTELVRDAAAARLKKALPHRAACIDRVLVGRGAMEADKSARPRIVPLPSIGHAHADHGIRRILVEVPPNCPLGYADLEWGFSGIDLGIDYRTGEVISGDRPVLTAQAERGMLRHYGIEPARAVLRWHTVTPAALAKPSARRRLDPARPGGPALQKSGTERVAEESRAAAAVVQALRHAGIERKATSIRVQREPFAGGGERAESFATGIRFPKERLWHVAISFAEPVGGPLIIGDGRYLGLGLMEPIRDEQHDVRVFSLAPDTRIAFAERAALLLALRRAVMALAWQADGTVPALFSGHEANGSSAKSGQHRHVFFAAADLDGDRNIRGVVIAAPWACDRSVRPSRNERALFDRVVGSIETVRAGRLGVISLRPGPWEHRLIGPSDLWETNTDYLPTRHPQRGEEPKAAILRDVVAECDRRGLARPEIEIRRLSEGPKGGVAAQLSLRFAVAVIGPIILGRDSHKGGGLFLSARGDGV